MTAVLAIDPGSAQSAWVGLDDGRPVTFGKVPNDELLAMLRAGDLTRRLGGSCTVVIENIEPRFGIHPGWETLDTARWTGRFQEAVRPIDAVLLKRSDVLRHLAVVTRGPNRTTADAGVRAALIDRYGGKEAAIGRKASPGPLHGIAADRWAALAVAVTYVDTEATR